MIVRELIALFGIEIDPKGVKKIDTQVSKVERRIKKVGKTTETAVQGFEKGILNVGKLLAGSIFIAGFARAAGAVVGFASDAEETLNLVRETFGENAREVEAWSVTMAKEVGRSEFLMREMAGTLGAVLTPMMAGNTQASADMSTGLATLAVDLASFFNVAESDVLVALRSGIVGETEPMRRFGADLLVASLEAFALSQGITKSFKSMTIAEKTTLRYQKILKDASIAQGDAARTSEGFANASRAASDGIKGLATRIGGRLLPVATRFVIWARDASRSLVEVVQKTNLLEATLIVMAAALGVVAIFMLAPFLPFLLTAAKVAVAIAVISLALDELITFFTGDGKTVIAEFIDELFGIGAAQQFLDDYIAGLDVLHNNIGTVVDDFKSLLRWMPGIAVPFRLAEALVGLVGGGDGGGADPVAGVGARAVGVGLRSAVVTSRAGSTGRDLRLARARELEQKRRLTAGERRGLARLEKKDKADLSKDEVRVLSRLQTQRSSGRRLRREQLTAREQLELSRITDRGGPGGTFQRGGEATGRRDQRRFDEGFQAFRAERSAGQPPNIINVTSSITIAEAANPEAVRRAVDRGLSDAFADAGASTARGTR